MKSILFVINTMGMGGGERALLELLKYIDLKRYKVSIFILTGQGELIQQIPKEVNILNKEYFPISVLSHIGRMRLARTVIKDLFIKGVVFTRSGYIMKNLRLMVAEGNLKIEKILWKIISDGAQKFEQEFDLAVAYLEGGSTYYVASHVKAKKKAAFIHINYKDAGYGRSLDEDCYSTYDRIFAVSGNVKRVFLSIYPEYKDKTTVCFNLIDREKIINKANLKGGFSDKYSGFRILTVGRLVTQKALDIAIETMRILKCTGKPFRWYVLGEGKLRKKLEEKIHTFGLDEDFILLGTVDNPFPYYRQCNLYVHTARFEGKSVAIEEAQILGCAILASEYNGVEEQIKNGVDGTICKLEPETLAKEILIFFENPQKVKAYGDAASSRRQTDNLIEINKLMELL